MRGDGENGEDGGEGFLFEKKKTLPAPLPKKPLKVEII